MPKEIVHTPILILGAGPTGLGAAKRLEECIEMKGMKTNFIVVDANKSAGGLASTDTTNEGFLFDVGGHVIFSHYLYFDQCVTQALPREEDWQKHPRVSYVRSHDTWVAYPFQNNIAQLPPSAQLKAMSGLIDAFAQSLSVQKKPANFDEWIVRNMGEGIADIFMRPYNYKVWGVPTTMMQCNWLGERVAAPDLKQVLSNLIQKKEAGNWGPNATFRFPTNGGTHGIWKAVAATLPSDKIHLETVVERIDSIAKIAFSSDGKEYHYDKLISTMCLDQLMEIMADVPKNLSFNSKNLTYSTTHVIGIGLRGQPEEIKKMCWMYFPEDNAPFYRATVFSNYSPNLVPKSAAQLSTLRLANGKKGQEQNKSGGPYWSLMLEVCESKHKPVNVASIMEDSIQGCIKTGLIKENAEIVSLYHRSFGHGYPTPTLGRDEAINNILPTLQKDRQIWSRGRFGAWKYEVANQDHSFMQGVEAVDNILFGSPELTVIDPNWVNSRSNNERQYVRA